MCIPEYMHGGTGRTLEPPIYTWLFETDIADLSGFAGPGVSWFSAGVLGGEVAVVGKREK